MKTLKNIASLVLMLMILTPAMAESYQANDQITANNQITANIPITANNPVQTTAITGTVIDNNSGETLAGVLVTVEGTEMQAYTDLDGQFSIEGMTPGKYNLILSLISYKKSLVEDLEVKSGKEESVEIKLNND